MLVELDNGLGTVRKFSMSLQAMTTYLANSIIVLVVLEMPDRYVLGSNSQASWLEPANGVVEEVMFACCLQSECVCLHIIILHANKH